MVTCLCVKMKIAFCLLCHAIMDLMFVVRNVLSLLFSHRVARVRRALLPACPAAALL